MFNPGRRAPARIALILLPALLGCGRPSAPRSAEPPARSAIYFRDVAKESGIDFRLGHGGKTPLTILDSLGQGCGFLDFDNDGFLDLWLVSDKGSALYRNLGGSRFKDVTAETGANVAGYWHGISTGDFDNDGDPDICLTGYRCIALLQNDGGKFRDITKSAGLATPGWASTSAFVDLDSDGLLDLIVGEYLEFGPKSVQLCQEGGHMTACGPKIFPARHPRVYRNLGNGRFRDSTKEWGFGTTNGKCLGITVGDFNGDGSEDVALANDETPQDLFIRSKGRPIRYRNESIERSFAFLGQGATQSGMGIDVADFDRDGEDDIVITNFQGEPTGFYKNQGGVFDEISSRAGVGEATWKYVGWGVRFFDADNDGLLDLIIANGHIQDNVRLIRANTSYPEPTLFFRQNVEGRYERLLGEAGEPFGAEIVGRGLAVGDFDNDGRPDVVISDAEGPTQLLHNESRGGNWLGLTLMTGSPPRIAIGSTATVVAGGKSQRRRATTTGSIFSAQDPRLLFGLGNANVEEVTVRWADGREERFKAPGVNRYLRLVQGSGQKISGTP